MAERDDPLLGRVVVEKRLGERGAYVTLRRTDNAGEVLGEIETLGMLEMAKIIASDAVRVEDV
jgi:hypothetical protein